MKCVITTFMQLLGFELIFEERYFIIVIGFGDDLFCIELKKRSDTCLKFCVWIFSMQTKTNTFSLHHDSHKWFFTFESVIY